MAQVRNISPDKLYVGHLGATVDLDELLEVPDRDFVDRAWPTSKWKLVTPPASGTEVSIDDAIWWSSDEPETPETPAEAAVPVSTPAPADTDPHEGRE